MIIFLLILVVILLSINTYGSYVAFIIPHIKERELAWESWQKNLEKIVNKK